MSDPVRLRRIRSQGTGWEACYYPGGKGPGEPGTWYPDADGNRAARDVASELVTALLDVLEAVEPRDQHGPAFNAAEQVLAKARGQAAQEPPLRHHARGEAF